MQRNYGRGQWHDRKPVVSINLKWFCDIAIRKKYYHCWQQNKTMLLCNDVIITIKFVLVTV